MRPSRIGTCDYCGRSPVELSSELVCDERFVVNSSVEIRRMCLDQAHCRANGGDPPDPRPRTVSGSYRFHITKISDLYFAQEFSAHGSRSWAASKHLGRESVMELLYSRGWHPIDIHDEIARCEHAAEDTT